jgi:arylsulfatase A-like enzyme
LQREWRDARLVPGSGPRQLKFGTIPEDGAVRFAVYSEGPVVARVYAGVEFVYESEEMAAGRWSEHRADLAKHAGAACVVNVDAPGPVWLASCELVAPAAEKPNVLVFLADTVRLDFLSAYQFPLETSPALAAFAKDAIKFWRLQPPSSWTRPSVGTLFMSVPPNVHKAHDGPDAIRTDLPNLFDALAEHGYETQGFITNPNCLPYFGFGRGFERLVDTETEHGADSWREDVHATDRAVEAIRHLTGRPWAMYVHLMGPHDPYSPPGGLADRFMPSHFIGTRSEQRIQRDKVNYAGEILQLDTQFARIIAALKEEGVYENTLVVFLSDHGEQFQEHGATFHGQSLYDEEVRIPLIVKLPGNAFAGDERDAVVAMEDVAPTILDVLGLAAPASFEGESFREVLASDPYDERIATATLRFGEKLLHMARTREYKFIHDSVRGTDRWYNVLEDLKEVDPLEDAPAEAAHLRAIAMEAAVREASGMHVLLRFAAGGAGSYEVRLLGKSLGIPTCTAGAIVFDPEEPSVVGWRLEAAEAESARLHLAVSGAEEVVLSVLRDGLPVPAEDVMLGTQRAESPMDGVTVDLAAIAAGEPRSGAAGALVRVWGVAPAVQKDLSREAGDIHEALEALGYLK